MEENSTDESPDYSTYLVLSTTRLASFQGAGEMVYDPSSIQYASIRLLARIRGKPGAVAGIFTYYNETSESDIEILTRDPTTSVEYSNQPTVNAEGDVFPGSNFNTSMAAGGSRQWTDWNVYRLDWLPGKSAWYLNGEMAASTRVNVPGDASRLIMNMWSDGGFWSGNMSVGDKAGLQVQWIEMVFNTPDTKSGRGKGVVCSVDEVVGTPVRAEGVAKIRVGSLLLSLSISLAAFSVFF